MEKTESKCVHWSRQSCVSKYPCRWQKPGVPGGCAYNGVIGNENLRDKPVSSFGLLQPLVELP